MSVSNMNVMTKIETQLICANLLLSFFSPTNSSQTASCLPYHLSPNATDSFREMLVNQHNKYRDTIGKGYNKLPSASAMYQLSYSHALELLAMCDTIKLCAANYTPLPSVTCPYNLNSTNSYISIYKFKTKAVAEQSYELFFSELNITSILQRWFQEVFRLKPADIDSSPNKNKTSHIIIIAWWSLTDFGCARSINSITRVMYFICYYGSVLDDGKFGVGKPIYPKGVSCSKCPKDLPCSNNSSLCGSLDIEKNIREHTIYEPIRKDMHMIVSNEKTKSDSFTVKPNYISITLVSVYSVLIKLQ